MSYRAVLSSGLGSLSDCSWEGSWSHYQHPCHLQSAIWQRNPVLIERGSKRQWRLYTSTCFVRTAGLNLELKQKREALQQTHSFLEVENPIVDRLSTFNCWQVEHIQLLKLWRRDGKSEPQSAVNHMQLTLARFSAWYSTSSHGNLQINKHFNKLNTRVQITNIYCSQTCGAVCRLLMVSVSPKRLLRNSDSATFTLHHLLYASRTCSSAWHHHYTTDITITSSWHHH